MILDKLKKISSKYSNNVKLSYRSYLKQPIDDKLVLVEGGQGSNINGNMFSMLREINTNPMWEKYKTVFVVTDKTIAKARERMKFYGFDKVILSVRNSDEYCKYLATAKYLMTDNSFPPYFNKRQGQIFLNTWHGTPLKNLGKTDKSNLNSSANVQKNYLMCDYALFPNEFTRNVFMDDYDLEYIFRSKSLIANYPRNYVFYDNDQAKLMKSKLGYEGKTVFAYMPTWRGTGRTANTKLQLDITKKILNEFDSLLEDDTVLLVNLHFLLASGIDCTKYKHIDYFLGDYDTYEILNACDGLVTDYSSVFFDFAVTGKKIILFAYDLEDYVSSRGMYIPIESLPFPITKTAQNTVREMRQPTEDYSKFVKTYCTNGSVNSCKDIFELMVTGKSDVFNVEQHMSYDNVCMIYAGGLPENQFDNIRNYIKETPQYKHVIVYRGNLTPEKKEFMLSLSGKAQFYGLLTAFQYSLFELAEIGLSEFFGKTTISKRLERFYDYEKNRLFYSIAPAKTIDFSGLDIATCAILTRFKNDSYYVKHGTYFVLDEKNQKHHNYIIKLEKKYGFNEFDNSDKEDNNYIANHNSDESADLSYNEASYMKNILPLYLKVGKKLKCITYFKFRSTEPVAMNDVYLTVGENKYPYKLIGSKTKKAYNHRGVYSFTVPVEDVLHFPANNKVQFNYLNHFSKTVSCHAYYFSPLGSKFLGFRSSLLRDKHTNTIAVFRQTTQNKLNVYVRSFIVSDKFVERIKQDIAFVLSMLWFDQKASSLVLLYEKNSSKYEESASALYEKLLDSGYKYSYFICTKDAVCDVPEKYRKNILIKNSFKHYLYFFKAKTFIGTEALVHAIDLKTFNRFALVKIASKNKNYVFLQHGVMYMVSLDSESRSMFKRKELNGKYRVITSSKAEADHFTTLGRHEPEDIYITGLPKFDKNTLNPDADKIVIMPTWRPWEINTAREDFVQTSYYKMINKIYNSVPEHLKDKVIILPHPLIMNELKKLPDDIGKSIKTDVKYDDILKQTRVLITDYSSIAYDAFYRGTRVIFYWEEKDDCMAEYGPTTKLLLNEDNVYGDYFYSTDGLSDAIEENYNNPQKEEYVKKYRKIVTFNDGKNTERLIRCLEKDKIIKKKV